MKIGIRRRAVPNTRQFIRSRADDEERRWAASQRPACSLVPVNVVSPVLSPPCDATRVPFSGMRFMQFVHCSARMADTEAQRDAARYRALSGLRPSAPDLLAALESRNGLCRLTHYADFWASGFSPSVHEAVRELRKEPYVCPLRLALLQLVMQTMLGPHRNVTEAMQIVPSTHAPPASGQI